MLNWSTLGQYLPPAKTVENAATHWHVKNYRFDLTHQRVLMGVINLSPDSAYRESVCTTTEAALERAQRLALAGAHVVDVGAESTLPQAQRVTPQQQLERLLPVVEGIAAMPTLSNPEGQPVPPPFISVESYYPEVLEACAKAGAHVFNLTGTQDEEQVFDIAATHQTAVILCHVPGPNVRQAQQLGFGPEVVQRIGRALEERVAMAHAKGVQGVVVDPGLGFYYRDLEDGERRVNYQVETLLTAYRFHHLGVPVMNILPHAPQVFGEEHRQEAEPFFAVLALLGGTHLIRTHEVEAVGRIARLMDKLEVG